MQTLRVLLFTADEDQDTCNVQRDITSTGSVYTYLALKEARAISDASGRALGPPLHLFVTCDKPCKPHLSVHLHGLATGDNTANEIRVRV